MRETMRIITLSIILFCSLQFMNAEQNNRRLLHQPLLIPEDTSSPPPPAPEFPDDDLQLPFSNELPTAPVVYQQPPPLPAVATPLPASPPTNPTKKVAIVASSTILTLGMLSVMAFYLHKNRQNESHKLSPENPPSANEEPRMPPSSGSPYRKLKISDHLPPLPPPPPFRMNSPPPMSSSDDESNNSFYTSKRTPIRPDSHASTSVPHSKRTPSKSRFSASSSPDTKPVIKQSPPTPSRTLPYSPKRAKFTASPHTLQSQSTSKYEQKACKTPIPPPPPPPPPKKHTILPVTEKTKPVEEVNKDESTPKMKHLHWDKVQATENKATVWDRFKSPSFKLNEDAVETLFRCKPVSSVPREATRKFVLPSFKQEIRILDPKKSQNIAILLRAFNVTREEVSEALLDGNPEGLGPELFETLVKMAPSKEEEIKLKDFNDDISKLGTAERFLKAILDIPFAFRRVEAMLYRANFSSEVKYLRKSFQTLEGASEELKNSRLFLKLLEAVLRTGNRMNNGTNRGDAKAFKLDTLLKLVDIKGTDGKTTLLHFVVQEIIRSEGAASTENLTYKSNFKLNEEESYKQGLQVVAGLSKELGNVKKSAGMDSDVLSSYVSKLEQGLQKVRQVLQYENQLTQEGFFVSMKAFLEEAVDEILRIKAEERKALSLVKEVTQYFHGDYAKQEAQPLRMFMVIRDFLSVLDNVCKDVGRMQDRTMGSGRSFRILATVPLPALSRFNVQNTSSDEDSM